MSLKLPPLPDFDPMLLAWNKDQMEAYAREAQRMALEEAAKVCAPHSDDDAMDRAAKAECAAAIRKLAEQC